MRVQNITSTLGCLLCIALTFVIGCAEKKPKEKEKKEVHVQARRDLPEREEILLDDAEGEASLARNFYFIFDGSGSMNETCAGQEKLQGAKDAVRKFLTKVPADVNLGLFVFDAGGTREAVPLASNNRDAFMQAINEIKSSGGTPLAASIRSGTDRLVEQYKKQLGYGDYRLIAVTDGQAKEIPGATQYAARFGMPIYAIGLCIEGDHPLRTFAMSYREANNYEDLERALEETVAELPSFDVAEFGD